MSSSTSSVDDGISLRLRGGPEAAARARRALSTLRADIDPPLMETLRLLVTELVSNSVRHAQSETVVLRVLVARTAVLTEVTDEGPGFDPTDAGAPGTDDSGWGQATSPRSGSSCAAARAVAAPRPPAPGPAARGSAGPP